MDATVLRYAVAGTVAAGVWAGIESPLSRALDTGFTDCELLGRVTGRSRAAGTAVHLANGALFGAAFAAVGGRGVGQAVIAAEIEGTVLWPGIAVLDREHFTRRVFAQEALTHAVFGVVLGLVGRALTPPR
jgi:hypothetical protein